MIYFLSTLLSKSNKETKNNLNRPIKDKSFARKKREWSKNISSNNLFFILSLNFFLWCLKLCITSLQRVTDRHQGSALWVPLTLITSPQLNLFSGEFIFFRLLRIMTSGISVSVFISPKVTEFQNKPHCDLWPFLCCNCSNIQNCTPAEVYWIYW